MKRSEPHIELERGPLDDVRDVTDYSGIKTLLRNRNGAVPGGLSEGEVASASSIGTILKESLGYSIGLSVLVIVAGIPAIVAPPDKYQMGSAA